MNLNATLFAQSIVFLVLVMVTWKFIWPPLDKALEDRRKKIADGLAAADRGNASLADAQKKIAALEAETRGKAQAIIAEHEKRAAQIIVEAQADAKVRAEKIIADAEAEAQQQVVRARNTLRDQVAALAVAGAEQILKREVNAQAHADLLGQLKARL
jgi:F-type H+-transporting ATPase subunit b